MNLTAEELNKYRKIAIELNLEGKDLLLKHNLEYINLHCNGIGPERWPSCIRAAIDKLHKSAILASMIHDLWWDEVAHEGEADMYLFEFHSSNRAYEANARKLADYYYGWYNPVRYLARREAGKFRLLLDNFGWTNFLDTVRKHEKKN